MSAFLLTLAATLVMLLIVGVHTSTQRVVQVLITSIVLFVASIFFIPTVASIITPGGPARSSNGQVLQDDSGKALYTQDYMRSHQNAEAALGSITYLCASLAGSSFILLFYRFFAASMDTARRPPLPFEDKKKR